MTEMTLPRLAGSRKTARRIVETFDGPLTGSLVVLNCRELQSAPHSFADEIVVAILVDGQATMLTLKDASDEFEGYVRTAARLRGLEPHRVDAIKSIDA